MSATSFHSRNAEDLGLISRPWGDIFGASLFLTEALEVSGGLADFGTSSTSRAILSLKHGGGGNTPAAIALNSPNGTTWYLFVEDDGTLKVSSSMPEENSDGNIVGSQF